ncbi:metal-sensing transcriptional repressor [Nevskia soli]|uniref:metal-sensing transcriptional repressor n=1 Tax=Nevskia soli TaxID=418856 RepID=UPI0004A6E9A8|nr:metal-sensing transcriptional repressor [Nevskia soli]
MSHPTAGTANPEIVKRLRRAIGQLNTVVAMIEDHRECAEVAMQLQAAEKAVTQAKKTFIHEHIAHRFEPGDTVSRQALAELHEISKYL